MPSFDTIAMTLLLLSSLLLAAFWLIVIHRIRKTLRQLPSARDGAESARANPPEESVCVIVPAHNESDVIEGLVRSLRAQRYAGPIRFLFALDRCTDDTERIAREAFGDDDRFEIIEIRECPADWAGKVNAIWTAVNQSETARSSDLLLFADADTIFDPDLVAAAVALLRDRDLEMLSLWSTLSVRHWFEWLVQPACGLELMYQYPLLRANRHEERRAFANGQFILFRRDAYDAMGGHEAVNEAVLEDMALARLAADRGMRAGVFYDEGMLQVRMYETWDSFYRGWKRIYIDCTKRKLTRLWKSAWRIRSTGTVLPLVVLLALVLSAAGVGGAPAWLRWSTLGASSIATMLWTGTLGWIYYKGRFPIWAMPLHPIGCWIAGTILLHALRDLKSGRPVRWGGKEYLLQPR